MRSFCVVYGLIVTFFLLSSNIIAENIASAEETEQPPSTQTVTVQKPPPTLDELYTQLHTFKTIAEAEPVMRALTRSLADCGSDKLFFLLQHAIHQLNIGRPAAAMQLLNIILAQNSEAKGAWYYRALVHIVLKNYSNAISDLHHVLALEPRHFHAWETLGALLQALDQKQQAYKAYEQALKLNPFLIRAQEGIVSLQNDVLGQAL